MTDPTDLIARADAALDGAEHLDGATIYADTNQFVAAAWLVPALRDALAAALARATLAERHEEELEASLAEMTRRRNEWRKKAEGFNEVRLALREKVGEPWPPSLSRILWAGLAADQKRRADDAEAKRDAALARAEAAECHAEAMVAARERELFDVARVAIEMQMNAPGGQHVNPQRAVYEVVAPRAALTGGPKP